MNDLQKLALVVDGKTVISPCLEIMALSTTPKAEGAAGYVRFFDAFARRFGGHMKHYRLNDSKRWKKLQPKDHGKVSWWFSDARSLKATLLGITMHGHDPADEPQPPLFRLYFEHVWPEYPRGMFHIVLPLEHIEGGVSSFLELVDDAMAEFPVHWGTAGLSFYWESTDTTIRRYADQWLGGPLAKHPGLAPGNLLMWGAGVEEGVANIGWLTFVGDALVEKLGGPDAVAAALRGTDVELRRYATGMALQAGPVPELGDVNRKQDLPAYREVGRVLEPVFASDEDLRRILVTGIRDEDARLAWLRRFLP